MFMSPETAQPQGPGAGGQAPAARAGRGWRERMDNAVHMPHLKPANGNA